MLPCRIEEYHGEQTVDDSGEPAIRVPLPVEDANPGRDARGQREELEEKLSRSHAALTESAERDEHREIENEVKRAGMSQVAGDRPPPLEGHQEIPRVLQLGSKAGVAGRGDRDDGERRGADG